MTVHLTYEEICKAIAIYLLQQNLSVDPDSIELKAFDEDGDEVEELEAFTASAQLLGAKESTEERESQ
jgi:hypothetical protein